MKPKIYTVVELAEILGVSDATIRNEVRKGKLEGFKVGNENRFTQYHIDQYTQIKNLGKSEREMQLEEEKKMLLKIIEDKDQLIRNIKDMILKEAI